MVSFEGWKYSTILPFFFLRYMSSINKSVNKLKARGIFGNVQSKIMEGSSPDLKVLEISIEEKATGEIMAGAGVGTDGTSFMMAISENNWLGRGVKLESSINVSETKVSGGISVNNPNYKYTGNAVYAALDVSSSDFKETSGYESSKTGFDIGTEFEQYENIFLSPALSASFEDIEVSDNASTQISKMEGSYSNIDFAYGIILDKRNQPFQPTSGYRTKFIQKLPLILDSASITNGFEISGYHAFSENVIGAA